MEAFAVLLVLAFLATPFVALGLVVGARKRLRDAEERIEGLRAEGRALEDRLLALKREIRDLSARVSSEGAEVRRDADTEELPLVPERAAAPPPPPAQPVPPPPAFAPPPPPVPRPVMTPPVAPPPVTLPPPAGAPPPPTPRPPSPPAAPAPPRPSFDWEGLVGVRLFSWVAGISLVVAAVFFLRYSIDHGWLKPPVRMAIGVLTGLALLVVCELKAARRYRVTANALDGAAIAILFSTVFASHALWKLVGALPAFALMALVAAVAVLLSIRRDSIFIALLGLLGGFATPALLSTGEDRPIGLFGYLLLLNAGLAWVAHRKKWPVLTAVALALTTLYQWGWVAKFLTASKLPLALGIFAVFPVLSLAALALGRKEPAGERTGLLALFERTGSAAAALPLLFAVYLAAVPAYGERWGLLFGFLLLLDLGLLAVALWRGPMLLHLLGAASTLLVTAVWLAASWVPAAWPGLLGFLSALVLLYLGAPFLALRLGRPLAEAGTRAVFAAPLLLFAFPVLAHLEPRTASPALLFAVLFLLLGATAAYAMARSEGAVYYLGAFLALAAEAVWSARHLTPERLLPALAVYGVFALFYLGVPLAARRLSRDLRPEGSASVLLLASLALLLFLAAGPAAEASLWGLALLLAVVNAGLFLEGSAGRFPVLTLVGTVASWVVLAVWWVTATVSTFLVPALAVVAGFGVLTLAGNLWARSRAGAEAAPGSPPGVFDGGLALGLAGHLFLVFVASQPGLAVPPWPLLGVLFVLCLAVAAAALAARRGVLQAGSLGGAGLVLLVLSLTAGEAPWPSVTVLSAVALGAFGLAFLPLARRRLGRAGAPGLSSFDRGAALGLLLAQLVASLATFADGRPPLALLLGAQAALVAGLLAVAWASGEHVVACLAVAPAALASFAFASYGVAPAPGERLLFGGVLYALFLAFPLVLGERARASREAWLAPLLFGVPFFFLGRRALLDAGLGGAIGLLPVAQAALTAVLLVRLLSLEPPGKRSLGRLALVAGAVLAFVTVAIPLQLEKQWITLGWALEGAALAWLFSRVPHRGLLVASTGLLLAAFVRLSLNPAVLTYHERSTTPVLNWYLYSYLVAAAAFFAAARFLKGTDDSVPGTKLRVSSVHPAFGTVLLFLLLNIEIADWFSSGPALTFRLRGASFAQDMATTLGWALFAIGLLAAGVVARSRPARIASIALLVVTVLKAFLHDLGRLGGLYRVASFVGLAASLALVALLIQRFARETPKEPTT
ncbi:MAG: DUF2339 domain-containing protein [Acidobacteria bacterium]|nr:MAG: DUF2339 domain-containing protein [Acidobacteriota bacterium]